MREQPLAAPVQRGALRTQLLCGLGSCADARQAMNVSSRVPSTHGPCAFTQFSGCWVNWWERIGRGDVNQAREGTGSVTGCLAYSRGANTPGHNGGDVYHVRVRKATLVHQAGRMVPERGSQVQSSASRNFPSFFVVFVVCDFIFPPFTRAWPLGDLDGSRHRPVDLVLRAGSMQRWVDDCRSCARF